MSFTSEILKRPTISKISSYLLYGTSEGDNRQGDYETRLKTAFSDCESTLSHYDSDKESALYQAVYALVSEHEKVYMEIGFQSGLLLMNDAIRQQKALKNGDENEDVTL